MNLNPPGLKTAVEPVAPTSLDQADLTPRGPVHPSPDDWADQVLYFLLPDRFSDGNEDGRPLFDRANPDCCRSKDHRGWMKSGCCFQQPNLLNLTVGH